MVLGEFRIVRGHAWVVEDVEREGGIQDGEFFHGPETAEGLRMRKVVEGWDGLLGVLGHGGGRGVADHNWWMVGIFDVVELW